MTSTKRTLTFAELKAETGALVAVLGDLGVGKGDRVISYMPMVPEAVILILACARIGAVHSVVFGGFAVNEIAAWIDDAVLKVIVSASSGIEPTRVVDYKALVDDAIAIAAKKPSRCVILQRETRPCTLIKDRDEDYTEVVGEALIKGRVADCVPVAATDSLYILYTSGTTGQPKGVVRDKGGRMVALNWTMPNHYDMAPGGVFWATSDVGWVVGHSYVCYGPLLHGCATVVYEGKLIGTPDASAFWRIIDSHKVAALFTAPTAFRAIHKASAASTPIRSRRLRHWPCGHPQNLSVRRKAATTPHCRMH